MALAGLILWLTAIDFQCVDFPFTVSTEMPDFPHLVLKLSRSIERGAADVSAGE